MSLMQKGVDTYNAMEHLAGVPIEGKQTLAPIGHIAANASIEITIDADGSFVNAKQIDEKAIIPCTEDSASRSGSKIAPHPLCDQVGYLSGKNIEKYDAYIQSLEAWIDSGCNNAKVLAVFSYVKKKSLLTDLGDAGLKKISDNDLIVWRVIGIGFLSGSVCEDTDLQKKYSGYYLSGLNKMDYCMVTGEQVATTAKHLKGVVASNGNAKIISSNDTSNYTYRGRFNNADEACSVGYVASQKAHNALKWIVANDGVFLGNRVCVCWNPSGLSLPKLNLPIITTENNLATPTEYKAMLRKKVMGYKRTLPKGEGVVVAMFDAATTGRLSITYYNELDGSDFVERLATWDESTCFPSSFYGVQSPKLSDFVNFAYGTYHGEYFNTDDKVFKQHMQRMLVCRINNGRIPADIIRGIVKNCARLYLYNISTRDKVLHTVCAAIKKRDMDINKEEWSMTLENKKQDRSYQYGRLLAILEKMERDTYDADEKKRETNAIRSQHMFVQRPQSGFVWIMEKLQQSYTRKLSVSARVYYDRLIQEIVAVISECEEDVNKPLSETYLMGYYLQKQALYTGKDDEVKEEDE